MDAVMQALQGGQAPPDAQAQMMQDPQQAMADQPGQMAAAIAMLLAQKAEEAHAGVDAAVEEEVQRLQQIVASAAQSPHLGTLNGPMPPAAEG